MNAYQAAPLFRPITLVLEDQDDRDKMFAVLSAVVRNAIHITPQTITAAKEFLDVLNEAEGGDA